MTDISLSGGNARFVYKAGASASKALFRCSDLADTYSVNSSESHARKYRAFYPFLRVQGNFTLTLDFIHWEEYEAGMNWFRDYFTSVLSQNNPSPMEVQVADRNFTRLALPVSGISYGDHVASMVFAPQIGFVTVANPNDPAKSLQQLNKISSSTKLPAPGTDQARWFYPNSTLNAPGALETYYYDESNQNSWSSILAAVNRSNPVGGGHPLEQR